MKKVKKIQAEGFYIFRGKVAANSNYFEQISEAKQFLTYANYFLKGYVKIYDYVLSRHGWQMVVKLKKEDDIKALSGASSDQATSQDVWRIISERIRLMLSVYVRVVNRSRGRTGVLVHGIYERFYFDSLQEVKSEIDGMRNQLVRFYQRKRKYRGKKSHYKIDGVLGKGSIFLCSKEVRSLKSMSENILESLQIGELTDLVLHKYLKFTKSTHQFTINPKVPPKLE